MNQTLSDERETEQVIKHGVQPCSSGINITAIKGRQGYVYGKSVGDKNTISYEYIDNGFIATMYFTAYELAECTGNWTEIVCGTVPEENHSGKRKQVIISVP